jgi:hypothetical protein
MGSARGQITLSDFRSPCPLPAYGARESKVATPAHVVGAKSAENARFYRCNLMTAHRARAARITRLFGARALGLIGGFCDNSGRITHVVSSEVGRSHDGSNDAADGAATASFRTGFSGRSAMAMGDSRAVCRAFVLTLIGAFSNA